MVKIQRINFRVLLCSLFLLSCIVHGNAATVRVDVNNIRYSVDDEAMTAEVYGPVSSSTTITNLVIPDFIEYNNTQIPVISIRDYAFYTNKNLSGSVTIGDNVEIIGDYSFENCFCRGSLIIGNSVKTIGSCAFKSSRFEGNLILGKSIVTIGDEAFSTCHYFTGDLIIPNSVKTIGKLAFRNSFRYGSRLILGDSIETIMRAAFISCNGFVGPLIIPNSVKTIGEAAFNECIRFTSLELGESLLEIGVGAFSVCSGFTGSLTIPNSVQTIGVNAFGYCSGFTGSLIIPDNVQTIGDAAFRNCTGFNGTLSFGNNLETIGQEAFENCSGFNGVLNINGSVNYIGGGAFNNCTGFTSLILGESIKTIGDAEYSNDSGDAFKGCNNLSDITCLATEPPLNFKANFDKISYERPLYVPSQSLNLYKNAADWKDFKYINPIPVEVTEILLNKTELSLRIGQEETLIATLTPEDATTEIVWSTENNDNIVSVDQNGKVTALKEGIAIVTATAGDVSASCNVSVIYPDKEVEVELDDIIYVIEPSKGTAYCKGPRIHDLKKENVTIKDYVYLGSLEFPVTSIKDSAFSSCTGLSGNLIIGDNVKTIGIKAFYECSGFTGSLTLPNSVQTIEADAFYNCSGFRGSLEIPNSVEIIGPRAFEECSGFTGSLIIGNRIQFIPQRAFMFCGFLGSLTIGNNVQTIDDYAFYGCSHFTGTLTIPSSVETIGNNAFGFCNSFWGSLDIPNSVRMIGERAFSYCSGFEVLTLGENVQTIGGSAFSYCSKLTGELRIPETVKEIRNSCFAECNNLTSLLISSSNTEIYYRAFLCDGLESVTCLSLIPPKCLYGEGYSNVFLDYSIPLYVPTKSIESYKVAIEWEKFTNINPIPVEATNIELNKEELTLTVGEEETLIATLTPEDATTEIVWSTDNDNVISIDKNGKVKALKEGTTVVTAAAGDVSASCNVIVTSVYATSISISGNEVHSLKETETLQLSALVQPDNVTYPDVTWESSDSGVATVSNNGLVTAVSVGEVTITAYVTKQPEVKDSYSITIQKRILGDANDNGIVNIADVGTISDYIVEKPVYEFCFVNADVVTDKKITTADVTATLDIIFNDAPVMAKLSGANRKEPQSIGNLTIDNFYPSCFGNSVIGISLAENSDLVGIQTMMIIPEGMRVEKVSKGKGASNHILNYNITDHGTLNFILYSLNNSSFDTKNGPLVEITVTANEDCENIQMKNILASDAFANEYSLSFSGGENKGVMTSVSETLSSEIEISATSEGIMIANAKGEIVRIFATSGELIISETAKSDKEIYALSPGIYLVTVKEKTAKLIIK